jgi:hypothetical protein
VSGLKRLRGRVWAFFAKRALDDELEAEFETHLQLAHQPKLDARRLLTSAVFSRQGKSRGRRGELCR